MQVPWIDQNGVVILAGSDNWRKGYDFGALLEEAFPGQDADDFAYAVQYNPSDVMDSHTHIKYLTCWNFGERDGDDWQWFVVFEDDSAWTAQGGCDYTGWDCQSNLDWELYEIADAKVRDAAAAIVKIHSELQDDDL